MAKVANYLLNIKRFCGRMHRQLDVIDFKFHMNIAIHRFCTLFPKGSPRDGRYWVARRRLFRQARKNRWPNKIRKSHDQKAFD